MQWSPGSSCLAPSCHAESAALLSQLLQQFKTQAAPSAFVAVDGGGHEDEVGSEKLLYKGQGYGGRLVNNDQFCLAKFSRVSCWKSDVNVFLPEVL